MEQKIKKKLGGKPNKRVNKILIKHMSPNSVRQTKVAPVISRLVWQQKLLRRIGIADGIFLYFVSAMSATMRASL